MTVTERIEQALSQGILDYHTIQKIVVLDRKRHEIDVNETKIGIDQVKELDNLRDDIIAIIDQAQRADQISLGRNLRDVNDSRNQSNYTTVDDV